MHASTSWPDCNGGTASIFVSKSTLSDLNTACLLSSVLFDAVPFSCRGSCDVAFIPGNILPGPRWVCLKIGNTQLPNGFADHYPVFKWLAIIGNINPTFSDLAPGKYDSVWCRFWSFWDLRFGAEKGRLGDSWRPVRMRRPGRPAVALFQARPPGRRLRVTALPSCMELSETQNLAIHGIWMYGMLCMYGWCCESKPAIEGIFTLMESYGKLSTRKWVRAAIRWLHWFCEVCTSNHAGNA